jgi:hypothetical protein
MFLLILCAAGTVKEITIPGYSDVQITDTDIISIPMAGQIAVFLDVPPASFTALYKDQRKQSTEYKDVTVSEFSATREAIQFQSRPAKSRLRFWLLDSSVCPDSNNIAILNTRHSMRVETKINGTLCLFPHFGASYYRAVIDTGFGFPMISFYSALGHGTPVKVCRGEDDYCQWESRDPFFLTFQGNTHVNISYLVDGAFTMPAHCSILGVSTFFQGKFRETNPRLEKTIEPRCIERETGLLQASRMMGLLLAGIFSVGFGIRIWFNRSPVRKWRTYNRGSVFLALRQTYSTCL